MLCTPSMIMLIFVDPGLRGVICLPVWRPSFLAPNFGRQRIHIISEKMCLKPASQWNELNTLLHAHTHFIFASPFARLPVHCPLALIRPARLTQGCSSPVHRRTFAARASMAMVPRVKSSASAVKRVRRKRLG